MHAVVVEWRRKRFLKEEKKHGIVFAYTFHSLHFSLVICTFRDQTTRIFHTRIFLPKHSFSSLVLFIHK